MEKEAFLNKVDQDSHPPCWIWRGNINTNGYGRFLYQGKTELAQRASVRIFKGIYLEKGRKNGFVRAVCLNPLCVNPSHLEIASGHKTEIKKLLWARFQAECPEEIFRYKHEKAMNKRKLMEAYQAWETRIKNPNT